VNTVVDVSLIIVNWNTRDLLRKCLRSVSGAAKLVRSEVLVVDNGSSDGSAGMVRHEFPWVRLIEAGSNLGFARANNIAIRESRGCYVCLVNSDVVLLDGCIDRMVFYMDGEPAIGILGPRVLNADGTLQTSCRGTPTLWNTTCRALGLDRCLPRWPLFSGLQMTYWNHDGIRSVDGILGCVWTVRRTAIDRVGLLDERFFMYAEDMDYCYRCRMAGWDVVYYPKAEVIHYGGASSRDAPTRSYVEANRSSFLYWAKYYGIAQRAGFYGVILVGELMRIARGGALYLRVSRRREARHKIGRSVSCVLWLLGLLTLEKERT
jgi:GT2 family glycosyltransferase